MPDMISDADPKPGRLGGKSAVITGAAKGIGRATAQLFAVEGARLVITDIDAAGLGAAADDLPPWAPRLWTSMAMSPRPQMLKR